MRMTDNNYREVGVFVQNRFAGILKETDTGYAFQYDSTYTRDENCLPVSITLPLSDLEYRSTTLFSFFDGLIPEGWLLDVASRNWKLDRNDRFGLLMVCCHDCIGDVSIREVPDEV